jgi:hypothetical protein
MRRRPEASGARRRSTSARRAWRDGPELDALEVRSAIAERARRVDSAGGRVRAVRTEDRTSGGDAVVLAVGGWLPGLEGLPRALDSVEPAVGDRRRAEGDGPGGAGPKAIVAEGGGRRFDETRVAAPGRRGARGTRAARRPRRLAPSMQPNGGMTALDQVLPTPRLVEIDHVDVAVPQAEAWGIARHADFGRRSPLVRALFAIRTLATRDDVALRIDDLRSSPAAPGFQVLADDPPRETVVGAIGKVWRADIPFAHVADAAAFERFDEAGFVKVAWALRARPLGPRDARLELEVRVDATDDDSWRKFRAYFAVIGPGSRFVRRTLLAGLGRELGTPEAAEGARPVPGDDLLADARAGLTHGVTIEAPPEAIWPWLVQMGRDRAGFYGIDLLDNGGRESAREVHPEWQRLRVGDVIPARPGGDEGFEVLRLEPGRALVLGGLYDPVAGRQLPFGAARPEAFWHATWAFALEPLGERTTRLRVRARVAFSAKGALRAAWLRPVHSVMEGAQLRGLKARVEGTLPRDGARDVLAGVGGAAGALFALMTPFRRGARSHWGLDAEAAARALPGDDLVPAPRWSWTHAVEIGASAADVWPWVAQVGADRAGFYSYQWLENLAGCGLRNAEAVHPEWEVKAGDGLVLHPKVPPLAVVGVERGRWFVAHGAADEAARWAGRPWVAASWLFYLEPLAGRRCRLVSRYRAACSEDLATRLSFGPTLAEPLGFALDRRMLLGVRARVERAAAGGGGRRAFAGGAAAARLDRPAT